MVWHLPNVSKASLSQLSHFHVDVSLIIPPVLWELILKTGVGQYIRIYGTFQHGRDPLIIMSLKLKRHITRNLGRGQTGKRTLAQYGRRNMQRKQCRSTAEVAENFPFVKNIVLSLQVQFALKMRKRCN